MTAPSETSKNDFLPFALPDIGEEEIAEVVDTLRSGWLTTGKKTKRFEEAFRDFVDPSAETVAVNSATAGLHLTLEALGVKPGDEVITTPYTFTATAEVVRYLGAHPVFADIDERTLNISPAAVEAAITPRTRAIIPVHIGGLACDMGAILDIARRRGLAVIEDAAHALPTMYRGSMIGSLESDATVFSFYATKTLTTGEGGMVVTRRPELAARCRLMRLHGMDRDVFDRYSGERPMWYYEVVAPGYKYNLTDVAASLGLAQLRKVQRFRERRELIARTYHEALAELPLVLPQQAPGSDLHAWQLYVIRLNEGVSIRRNAFIQEMASRGIGTSVHFIPLHLHPYWRDTYQLSPDAFPVSLRAYQQAVSLPLYSRMTDADTARVISAVRAILRG